MLGLSRSTLKVDYSMATTDLYIRVLIECILDFLSIRPTDMTDESHMQTEDDQQQFRFCRSLWVGLGLDPRYPTVAAVTVHAFRFCEAPCDDPLSLYCQLLDTFALNASYRNLLTRVLYTIYVRLFSQALKLLLWHLYHIDSKARMPAPEGYSHWKPYAQWVKMVEEISIDVYSTIQSRKIQLERNN